MDMSPERPSLRSGVPSARMVLNELISTLPPIFQPDIVRGAHRKCTVYIDRGIWAKDKAGLVQQVKIRSRDRTFYFPVNRARASAGDPRKNVMDTRRTGE